MTQELLSMFLRRSSRTVLKNTQNSPLNSILKLIFLEIFKSKSFRFSQFSRNFFSDLCLDSSDRLTFTDLLYKQCTLLKFQKIA